MPRGGVFRALRALANASRAAVRCQFRSSSFPRHGQVMAPPIVADLLPVAWFAGPRTIAASVHPERLPRAGPYEAAGASGAYRRPCASRSGGWRQRGHCTRRDDAMIGSWRPGASSVQRALRVVREYVH
jgi:hypothetical protein